jgi:hypothetical protein
MNRSTTSSHQRILNLQSPTPRRVIDQKIGRDIFENARPFTLFNDEAMIDLLHTFVPHYNPPDRRTIADSILTECYENLQTKVNTKLAKEQYINVVFDETSNVRNQRDSEYLIQHKKWLILLSF